MDQHTGRVDDLGISLAGKTLHDLENVSLKSVARQFESAPVEVAVRDPTSELSNRCTAGFHDGRTTVDVDRLLDRGSVEETMNGWYLVEKRHNEAHCIRGSEWT